jgi:hypothetical protein
MKEDDPRTDEVADAEWHDANQRLFGRPVASERFVEHPSSPCVPVEESRAVISTILVAAPSQTSLTANGYLQEKKMTQMIPTAMRGL